MALLHFKTNITYFNNFTCFQANLTDPETNVTSEQLFCPQGAQESIYVVNSIPIASEPPAEGEELSMAGWGAIQTDGFTTSDLLLGFSAIYSGNFTCGLSEEELASDQFLCFGSPDPLFDACQADYGAPLVSSSGEQLAFYIRSEGDGEARKNCRGHGVYARTDVARDWILLEIANRTEHVSPASSLSAPFLTSGALLLAWVVASL
ncbi:MAG: trypsin-like serine protease [archaeon]|nr:trypsin-like serine protease [archaeon]